MVKAYSTYPHYDEIFEPVNELTTILGQGGWCDKHQVPTDIRLLVTHNGVGLFRQYPAQARLWSGWDHLLTTDPARIGPELLETHRRLHAWERNPVCGGCRWRWACGGIDAWEGQALNPVALSAGCEYRKLFLAELLHDKGQLMTEVLSLM